VILFGFRAKSLKIVEQIRAECFSQIKKFTNSEQVTRADPRHDMEETDRPITGVRLSVIPTEAEESARSVFGDNAACGRQPI
jgi:hypothetical protein